MSGRLRCRSSFELWELYKTYIAQEINDWELLSADVVLGSP